MTTGKILEFAALYCSLDMEDPLYKNKRKQYVCVYYNTLCIIAQSNVKNIFDFVQHS